MVNLVKDLRFPTIDEFIDYSSSEIQEFCHNHKIVTCYLPVDGTRRYFLFFQDLIQEWSEGNLEKYYEVIHANFRKLISIFYEFGIINLIVLLIDKNTLTRGKIYLSKAIELGIKPLYDSILYRHLYDKYEVNPRLGGFTSIYEQHFSKKTLLDLENGFSNASRDKYTRNLIIYNGLTPSEDYLLLENYAFDLRKNNVQISIKNLVKRIYGVELTPIDFSVWYGFPRDKIVPPLLWEEGTKFFTKNPTLAINSIQIKKMIYYCALSKKSLKDAYYNHQYIEKDKLKQKKEILEDVSIFGSDYYYLL